MSSSNKFEFKEYNKPEIVMNSGTLQSFVIKLRNIYATKGVSIVPVLIQLKNTNFCPSNYTLGSNVYVCGYSILINHTFMPNTIFAIMNLQSISINPIKDYRCSINFGTNSTFSDCVVLWH